MDTLQSFHQRIEKELQQLRFDSQPKELYEPMSYVLSLGGKHLRPVLLLMGCNLFEGDVERAVKPALGIELFHNFTLLHDDIMDNAPLRRAKPTVNKKWNDNIAILSGDAMFAYAYSFISQVDKNIFHGVLSVFTKTAIEVCEGQQLDMNYETQLNVSIDEYLQMIELKTAVLLAASLKIGSIIANAPANDAQELYEFGKNIGIAFQLQDDVLDVYGDKNKFGKQTGGDIISNKKTFLLLKALELAKGKTQKELDAQLAAKDFNPEEKVKRVTAIYDELSVKKLAEEKMDFYYHHALTHLANILVPSSQKILLEKFAEKLMVREV